MGGNERQSLDDLLKKQAFPYKSTTYELAV